MSQTTRIEDLFMARFKKSEGEFAALIVKTAIRGLLSARMKMPANKLDLTESGEKMFIDFCNLKEVKALECVCTKCNGSGVHWLDNGNPSNCAACIVGTKIMGNRGVMTLLDRIGHAEYLKDVEEKMKRAEEQQNRFQNQKPPAAGTYTRDELVKEMDKNNGVTEPSF